MQLLSQWGNNLSYPEAKVYLNYYKVEYEPINNITEQVPGVTTP